MAHLGSLLQQQWISQCSSHVAHWYESNGTNSLTPRRKYYHFVVSNKWIHAAAQMESLQSAIVRQPKCLCQNTCPPSSYFLSIPESRCLLNKLVKDQQVKGEGQGRRSACWSDCAETWSLWVWCNTAPRSSIRAPELVLLEHPTINLRLTLLTLNPYNSTSNSPREPMASLRACILNY